MLKKVLKLGLLTLILVVVTKIYIVSTTYMSLSALKEKTTDSYLLTYKWISSGLDGSLSIEGVEFTPYVLKRTFYIDKIELRYSNYFSLLSGISGLFSGDLDGVVSLELPEVTTEIKGKPFKQWLADETGQVWLKPFDLYGCGSVRHLSEDGLKQMGINSLQAAIRVDIEQNALEQDTISLSLDLKHFGRLELNTGWRKNSVNQAVRAAELSKLELQTFSLNYQEAGLFRRLNILCNPSPKKELEYFSLLAATEWKQELHNKGLMVSQNLTAAYREFLLQGGEIKVSGAIPKGVDLTRHQSLLDKELIGYFSARLWLNNQEVYKPALFVDSAILFPKPVPVAEKSVSQKKLVFKAGYREIAKENVANFIGQKMRVSMTNNKNYEGQLSKVTEYNLDLLQTMPGGQVSYPLMLNDIETVEIWFNDESSLPVTTNVFPAYEQGDAASLK